MIKHSKKSQPKLVKVQKNVFQRSQSVELFHSKSKGKSNKSLIKSSSTVHQNTSKFFGSPHSKIITSKQNGKIKKKFNSQKKKPCFKNTKKKSQKDKSKIKLKQIQSDQNKQNFNSSESCNNEQSWLQKLKKPITQYFFYHDNYIAIENTEQRKVIQRIKLIDTQTKAIQRQSKQPSHTKQEQLFLQSSFEKVKNVQFQNQQIMTQIPKLQLKQSQTQSVQAVAVQIQTTLSNRNSTQRSTQKITQQPSKCFSNTLVDLQFLFLPDKKNFQNFSEHQCQHYRELFSSLAKKFQKIKQTQQKIMPKQQISQQTVIMELYQRECVQMGWAETQIGEGFPTHIFSILSYISNLFCYAQLKEKSSIIAKMNSIYGFPFVERYVRVSKSKSTKRFVPVLSDGLYVSLEQQLFSNHQFPSDLVEQSVHTHNRMVFDCVNDFLQEFRPFYSIGGQPFPWNNSLGMTFYSIDEESLGLLFNQVKDKVVETATHLCGMHLDYSKFNGFSWQKCQKQPSFGNKHSFHGQRIIQQQLKMVNQEIKKIDQTAIIEEQYVKVVNFISEITTDQIFLQMILQLQSLINRQVILDSKSINNQVSECIEYSSDFEEYE